MGIEESKHAIPARQPESPDRSARGREAGAALSQQWYRACKRPDAVASSSRSGVVTGTPSGVGMACKPPRWLQEGDSVSVTIDRVGTLTNSVISEID
ncbi:MAG: fumarylacetoacetate hydrolase family protein [Terriglobales bacterium]